MDGLGMVPAALALPPPPPARKLSLDAVMRANPLLPWAEGVGPAPAAAAAPWSPSSVWSDPAEAAMQLDTLEETAHAAGAAGPAPMAPWEAAAHALADAADEAGAVERFVAMPAAELPWTGTLPPPLLAALWGLTHVAPKHAWPLPQ
jgi:hypothetical protein